MAEALLLIQTYQVWIYVILGGAGLVYLGLTLKWFNVYRNALFGLEKATQMAAELIEKACAALDPFAERAEALEQIARYLVERKK